MNMKTISNTFTVNTIIDGESAPYYFQEWFAWSNDPSTSSVITPPTISGSWATSIPAQGSYAYLWRKSIRYVWNDNTRQYTAETAQYFRMSGTNGTSITPKGNALAYTDQDASEVVPNPTDGDIVLYVGGSHDDNLDRYEIYDWPTMAGSWEGYGATDGDSYILPNGHLMMFSTEANDWLDLGQFQGQSGKTFYTHVAWATNVTYSGSTVTAVEGFVTAKSPNDTTHLWMGVLVNESSGVDPSDATSYTWSYTKGVDGFSVQAQYAPNNDPSSSQIHNTWQDGDLYMRTKQSNETTWSSWHKIVGESGGETNYQFAISANKVSQDGTSATAPTDISSSDWQDAPLIVTTAKPYLWSKVQKKDGGGNNVGNPSYMRLTGEESIEYSVEGALNTIKVGAGQTTTMVNCTYTFYKKPAVSSTRSTVSCYYAVYLRSGNTFSLLTMGTGYNNHGSGTSVTVNSNVPYKSGSVVYNAVVIYIFPSSYYSTSPESQNYMAKKEIPIVKDGDTAFVVDLENEMVSIEADEYGNTTKQYNFSSQVRAFYGATNVIADCTVTPSCNDEDVTATINSSTKVLSVFIDSEVNTYDPVIVTVTVVHSTYGTRTATFIISKITAGTDASLQELLPSLNEISFARQADKTLSPASRNLTLSFKKTKGNNTTTQTIAESGLTIRWGTTMPATKDDGTAWGSGTSVSGITWSSNTMTIANSIDVSNICIACFNSSGTLVDRETIPIIKDGQHGNDGDDAAAAFVSTNAITIQCDSDGNVSSSQTTSISFSMKVGTHNAVVSGHTSPSTLPTGVSIIDDAPTACRITVGTSATASGIKNGITFTVTGTYNSKTYTANVTVALIGVCKGGNGSRGKTGRFYYYAGEFDVNDDTHTFFVNDAQAPYFEHTENGQKRYHVFNYDTNGSYTMAQMWAISNDWNSEPWEAMTNDFKYLISEAIFGKYAHFGSAIINEDWLISGNGTINGALFKNGEEYNGVVAYTLFDPLFPYGIGNANVEINISEISWNYDSGNDIRAITDQYLLKAGRTYVVKILCHVERFYEGQQDDVFPKLLLWCPKDGVINDEAWIGETDASKYEEDQIFQKTINPASDGLYDIRAGLETNTTYGYGYVEMVVFECQTNTMFVPQYCVDLLSGETSMAGGKVQANRHGDFIIKGALMYSSLSQDRFILTNIDSTTSPDTYTYNLAKGVYEGQILSPKIPANYININGNLNYNNKSIYMIYLPPARLFEGMEITIISNARASNDGGQLVPLTFRVPTDFNTIDPVLDDATATVASTWNRFAVLYDGGGKISEGADGGIGGTHLVTRNANVIKLIATKHPFIEYYHPSQNSARQEAYNKKCIAWCAVDVK